MEPLSKHMGIFKIDRMFRKFLMAPVAVIMPGANTQKALERRENKN